jgi:outer membrane biosynthesis protein TonB
MKYKNSAILGTFGLAALLAGAVSAQTQGNGESRQSLRLVQAATASKEAPSRPATAREVRVRVFVPSGKAHTDDPAAYVEVDGERYVHFRSRQLKSPARPLGDPNLRYPTGILTHRNGAVVVQLLIDEHGELVRSDIVCAAPVFEKSALESVQGLRFQPAVAREGPVKSYMLVEFGYGKGYPCSRMSD